MAGMTSEEPRQEAKVKLRRQVTVWESFSWGYADVGADVYAALGMVVAVTGDGEDN
jgi:hypothetical protein